MKFYLFKNIVDDKSPYCETMAPIYGRKVKRNETMYDIPFFSFPTFEPTLDAFDLEEEQELRDFITTNYENAGLLMSNKLKAVLEAANLPDHRYYPAVIQHGKKRVTGYWFFKTVWDVADFIDYQRSEIVFAPKKGGLVQTTMPVTSPEKLRQSLEYARKNRVGRNFQLTGSLIFNEKFNELGLDWLDCQTIVLDWMVSERLKTAIEAAGLTGIEFKETDLIQTA